MAGVWRGVGSYVASVSEALLVRVPCYELDRGVACPRTRSHMLPHLREHGGAICIWHLRSLLHSAHRVAAVSNAWRALLTAYRPVLYCSYIADLVYRDISHSMHISLLYRSFGAELRAPVRGP